jgi:DNA-3-methyladenine glycosylase II
VLRSRDVTSSRAKSLPKRRGYASTAVIGAGERALARRDPALARVIREAGPCSLGRRRQRSHFEALVRSIAFQQLAGRAAAAIHGRLVALFDGIRMTPESMLVIPEADIRSVGLSAAKTASIRDLATKAIDGTLPLSGMSRLSDDEIVERLSHVRGIGRWTAEMFLIFQMARLDVWPVGDLGVRAGYALMHDLAAPPTPRELEPLGDPYRPYRSVAAWYCWQAVHLSRGQITPR